MSLILSLVRCLLSGIVWCQCFRRFKTFSQYLRGRRVESGGNCFQNGNSSNRGGKTSNEDFSVVQSEGARQVNRRIRVYNLDAVISGGYRVNSRRATQFRIWRRAFWRSTSKSGGRRKRQGVAPVRARLFVRAYHRFVGRRRSEGSGVFHQYYIMLTQN